MMHKAPTSKNLLSHVRKHPNLQICIFIIREPYEFVSQDLAVQLVSCSSNPGRYVIRARPFPLYPYIHIHIHVNPRQRARSPSLAPAWQRDGR